MKGLELTATTLAIIVFALIVALVLFLFVGSFFQDAGSPASNFFFKLFDSVFGNI